MTRIDFYLLPTDSEQKFLETVCLLIEKARRAEQNVYVHTRSAAHADKLDAALWQYRPSSFIPHLNLGQGPINTEPLGTHTTSQPVARPIGVAEPLMVGLPAATDSESHVSIGYCHEPAGRRDVLINLSPEVPVFFSRFRRTLEVVSGSDSDRSDSRERYRFYKARGYPLNHHNLS